MKHREIFVHGLALQALRALGVTNENPTSEQILDHSIVQACAELESVESALEHNLEGDLQFGILLSVVRGIRKRLELAQECNETLAELTAEREAVESQAAE